MLLGDDVLDMERNEQSCLLWQEAVLASKACPFSNPFAGSRIHGLTRVANEHLSRLALQNGYHVQRFDELLVFRILIR